MININNDKKIKSRRLFYILATIQLVFLVPIVNVNINVIAASVNPNDVIQLTNNERLSNGLLPLSTNIQLMNAAASKAQHMIDNNYFDHNAPDGTMWYDFITNEGYVIFNAGENLAYGQSTAEQVVTGWINSDVHRANMLSVDYEHIGVAVINGPLFGSTENVFVAYYGSNGPVSPPPGPSVADINSDGFVDIVDLSILLYSWNTNNVESDINSDGSVDIVDLSMLLSNWGAY